MDVLGKLFGSQARVKILRLFLLNPLGAFDSAMIATKSKVREVEARRELTLLKAAGIIGDKSFFKKTGTKSKRVAGYQLKSAFPHLAPLKSLIVSETPLNRNEIANRLKGVGKIKFLTISGVFLGEPEARLDILIVGDELKKRSIETVLRSIEAEIGKELTYGMLDTAEFLYRLGAYDKFVRDVLDFRHDTIIDRLRVE
jgi:hypothetical protein